MAMNKQRRTSNILNIVSYDASGNVTLPAGLTVSGLATAGFVKTNASGVMSIDTNVYLTTAADWFGAVDTGGTLDFNHVTNTRPGTGYTLLLGSATNGPGNGSIYYHTLNFEYSSKNGTGNISQFAIAYGSPGDDLKMRGRYANVWGPWVTFLNSGNFNTYAPSLTGSGAYGNWSINITGSASTIAGSGQGLTYQAGDGSVAYSYAHLTTTPGIFPLTDNANGILTVSRHPGNYYSQLGFSSNGNLYYRNFVNTAINTSQAWKTLLDSSNAPFAPNMNQNVRTSDNVSFQGISQNDIVGRPYAAWGATSATGPVVVKFPGTGANYGMIHAVIDIYEYNSNNVCTVIVGGHNWSNQWYSYGANSVGFTNKQVRVAFKDGQYCIVVGDSTSTWSYAQVVLRKISNGAFYQGSMNVSVGYTADIEADSYTWVSEDLRGLRVPNSISVSGNTVLHAANYNSYAPSLTGAGASGSWGINISGNAATATSATILNSSHYILRTGTTGNYDTDFNNTPVGSYRFIGDHSGGTNNPGGAWWFVQNFRHNNSDNIWGTQVAWGWEDNANRLATRNVQQGNFGAWVYYLNSANYNSYAPTLAGVGASGTWGISISGTAANANTLDNIDSTGFGRAYSSSYGFHGTNSAISTATFISILNSQGAFNQPYWIARGSWCYACNGYITDTGVGSIHLAGCTVEVMGDATNFTIRIHTPTTSSSGLPNREFVYVQNSTGYSPGWRVLFNNINYTDYTVTKTGGGASGTWGISITGNAATVGGYAVSTGVGVNTVVVREASGFIFANYINSNVSESENPAINTFFVSNGDGYLRKATVAHVRSALGESDTLATVMSRGSTSSTYLSLSGGALFSGANNVKFRNEKGSGVYLGSTSDGQLQAYSEDGGAAFMSFHRAGVYAVNMGLDPDSVFRIGGWSAAANRLVLDMSGNLSVPGNMASTQMYASGWFRNNTNNTGLYNENTTMHWSSKDNGYWDASSTTSVSSIRFFTGGHVNAGTLRGYLYATSGNEIGFLDNVGNWVFRCLTGNSYLTGTFTATGDVIAYSDARIKTNVQTIDNALEKVISMRGVTYNRTDIEDKSEKVGVIAQEIEQVLPQVVTKDDSGILGVSYGNITAVLIEAIKEQQLKIEALENQIRFIVENK